MTSTHTYLDDAHNVVKARDATWLVETHRDNHGLVVREEWYRLTRQP